MPTTRAGRYATAALRRAQIFDARLKGMSFRRIGQALGISATSAYQGYETYIRQHTHPPEEIERVRELEIQRLELQREKVTPGLESLDPMIRARTSDALIRISERLGRLRPIEVPREVAVSVTPLGLSPEERLAVAQAVIETTAIELPRLPAAPVEAPEDPPADPPEGGSA